MSEFENSLGSAGADLSHTLLDDTRLPLGVVTQIGPYKVEGPVRTGTAADVLAVAGESDKPDMVMKVFTRTPFEHERHAHEVGVHTAVQTAVPGVVKLIDHNVAVPDNDPFLPEVPYMVLERAKGGSLLDAVRTHGGLGTELAVALFEPIAATLDGIHEAGYTHRDVKSSNLLLDNPLGLSVVGPSVKVADFGLSGPPIENEGNGKFGTAGYAAPEMYKGITLPESDQFGAAAALVFVAGGRKVLTSNPENNKKILKSPENYDLYVRGKTAAIVPQAIRPAVRRALDYDPDNRYPTVTAFVKDVHARHLEATSGPRTGRTIIDMGRGRRRVAGSSIVGK